MSIVRGFNATRRTTKLHTGQNSILGQTLDLNKSQTLKKNSLKIYEYAVSSRNFETFKMISISLSSTDQNMPAYSNLSFIDIKKLFFSFINFFSVCIHQNVLFALHAQMVSLCLKVLKAVLPPISTVFTLSIDHCFGHALSKW